MKDRMERMESLVGRFVFSKAGHDKGTLYVVLAEEEELVYLCDGRLKPLEKPKKKRRKHIQPVLRTVDKELSEAIREGRVRNEQIKFAIKQYQTESR